MTTGPYSPATATSIAEGATDNGWVENNSSPGWDISASRSNLLEVSQQVSRLFIDQRDNLAALRASLWPTPVSTVKVLAAGDSTTVGFGSTDGKGYWGWLKDLLGRQRIGCTVSLCAHGGWYLADLKANIAATLTADTPDLVLVNIGTNDYDFNGAFTVATYGALIDQILASSSTVKVGCALIPISQTATGISANEQQANNVIQQAVTARLSGGRVALVDLRTTTQAWWEHAATQAGSYPPPGRWTLDGVHPVDASYLQTAQTWLAGVGQWIPGYVAP